MVTHPIVTKICVCVLSEQDHEGLRLGNSIAEGRNTKQRISSKAAQKAPPLPSVTEDELDEQQTSLAMDELKNTQKADGILNSKTQISIAMDELDNAQYANEKLNSNVQTGEKKGVTKKRPLQENVLKMK